MNKRFIERIRALSPNEQRVEVAKKLKQLESDTDFLKKISRVLSSPGGKLKLSDWDRPDLDVMKHV